MKASNKGDLTNFVRQIEQVFQKHFGDKGGRPAMAVAFTFLPWRETYWLSNVSRQDGIALFKDTAQEIEWAGSVTGGPGTSTVGNLSSLAKELERAIRRKVGRKPAMTVVFTLPPDYQAAHWVTNLSHADAARLFRNTAKKMTTQSN